MLIFLMACNAATSQHVGYRDKTKPPLKPVVKLLIDTVRVIVEDSVAEIITPHNECPGMRGPLPVLINYVPPEIVNKFRIQFKGHVYSITSIKVSANQFQYKLKVCYNGEFVIRFVDIDGDILR